jgi:diguanylate cyclase (GGDEF)-like protein
VRQAIGRLVLAPAGEAMEGLLTISIGIAELHGESPIEWLQRADAALYRAKELGRNRVEVAQELRPA